MNPASDPARDPASSPGCRPASHIRASDEATPRGVLRSLCSSATLAGGLTEFAWVGAHLLMYPLGTRTEELRPDQRKRPGEQSANVRALFAADPLASRTPVVLVHGLIDNRSIFAVMRRALRRRGFTSVCSFNYSPLLGDISRGAHDLGEHIDRVREQTGHERVHVVGHSLGGLLARYHLQRQGGDQRIESLVTLGTPHQGSLLAHLLPTPLVRQLRPGSHVFQDLAERASGIDAPVTAVYSDMDQVVLPVSSGRCEHPDLAARNILVRGVGHMSLPIHRGVVDEVAATLAGRRTRTVISAPAVA